MQRTDPFPGRGSKSSVLDVTYEDVRQSFILRLHGDAIRLAALRAALATAEYFPAAAFVDLEKFAHRLRGAAAVFGLPELRDAAKELELAASAAVAESSAVGAPLVHEAIRILTSRLSCLNSFTQSSGAEVTPVPAN